MAKDDRERYQHKGVLVESPKLDWDVFATRPDTLERFPSLAGTLFPTHMQSAEWRIVVEKKIGIIWRLD